LGATINIANNEILRDLARDGQSSIIRIELETKFGRLPKWVDERLSHATLSDVERWAKKLISAGTIEDVRGKKQSFFQLILNDVDFYLIDVSGILGKA
jgi:hypothetical protein